MGESARGYYGRLLRYMMFPRVYRPLLTRNAAATFARTKALPFRCCSAARSKSNIDGNASTLTRQSSPLSSAASNKEYFDVRDTIIVGSGPSGYTAALYTARAQMKPLMIAGVNHGGLVCFSNCSSDLKGPTTVI